MAASTYHTDVRWTGGHWGELKCGNGPTFPFSAPPDAQGHEGVLTPEDAFVAAVNTCVMLMFIWACERLRLDLISYECHAEGTKVVALDRTETFERVVLRPRIDGAGRGSQAAGARAGMGPQVQPGGELHHEHLRHGAGDRDTALTAREWRREKRRAPC